MNKYALAAVLLLGACGGTRSNPGFNQEKFDAGDQAYVVLSASNNASPANFDVYNVFLFKNENGDTVKLSAAPTGTAQAMIPAGKWTLVEYGLYGSRNYGKTTQSVSVNFSNYVSGGFSVPAGKAIYLGNIETRITKNNTSGLKKIFNMGSSASDLEFETKLNDDFANRYELMSSVKEKTGLAVEKSLMDWSKITYDYED